MQETEEVQMQSLGWENPLEEEMATRFSILAWRLPWTEGPGRLQHMGPQKVGHDWVTNTDTHKQYTMYFQNLYTFFHIVHILLQSPPQSILFSRFTQINRCRSNLFPLNDDISSTQEYTGIKPESPAWQVDSLPLVLPRKPLLCLKCLKYFIIHKRGKHEKQFIVKLMVC